MSFILDALKKSEIERQRQSEPGLMDAGMARGRRRLPVWAVLLGVLLAVNLIVLAVVLMRDRAPAAGSPAAGSPAAGSPAAGSPPAAGPGAGRGARPALAEPHFSPLDAAPVYAPEIPVAPDAGAGAGSRVGEHTDSPIPPAAAPPARSSTARIAAPLTPHRSDPVLTEQSAPEEDDEVLPSISEVNLTGADALPDLHLDVHVYATKPADRFVYINMRKYREGAVLPEGPTLERIRRDGVVLNFRGVRFVLPRQS